MAATLAYFDTAIGAGNQQLKVYTITPDASYPTGGYPITPAQVGLLNITYVDSQNTTGTTSVIWQYNYTTKSLQAYWTGPAISGVLAEVTNTTNLSTFPVRIRVQGF